MIRVNRIFWKVFFLFWVSNVLIVMGATFFVIHNTQSEDIHRKQKAFIKKIAEDVIEKHERGEAVDTDNFVLSRVVDNETNRSRLRGQSIQIYNEKTGLLVFRNRSSRSRLLDTERRFKIKGENGERYMVRTVLGVPTKTVMEGFRKFTFIQLILVFFFSSIISFILSWSISKPLNRLGRYSQQYKNARSSIEIDPSLLSRGDEIGDLSRDVHEMNKKIEGKIQEQKQLLHDVSHELRAPLARLQATAGLMQQQAKGDDVHIDRIHQECNNINALIQTILNFSRLEQSDIKTEVFSVNEILTSEIQSVVYQYPERNILLHDDVKSLNVNSAPDLLIQAFGNILRNACKYTDTSLIIDVTLSVKNDELFIVVRDHGDGVPSTEIDNLITPFYRQGNSMHADGHGLGLSIAKRAMQKLGGDLLLANHPEGGLEITLSHPAS